MSISISKDSRISVGALSRGVLKSYVMMSPKPNSGAEGAPLKYRCGDEEAIAPWKVEGNF